jgi:hypothetical protein
MDCVGLTAECSQDLGKKVGRGVYRCLPFFRRLVCSTTIECFLLSAIIFRFLCYSDIVYQAGYCRVHMYILYHSLASPLG